ncbi:unnamed protein product, partial [Rotaria sordida]
MNRSRQSREELDDSIAELNIRCRVCYKYGRLGIDDDEENICVCKRQKDEHESNKLKEIKWTMKNNTRENIQYVWDRFQSGAPYIRLALDTPCEKIEKIIFDVWKIPKPACIISILTDADYFKINDQFETTFINDIVDIIKRSDTWLLTSGYDHGFIHVVGRALNKAKSLNFDDKYVITAIGISKWGSIVDIKEVKNQKNEEREQRNTENMHTNHENISNYQWNLEINHTHYLMFDDGSVGYDDITDTRSKLVNYMARLNNEHDVF